MLKKIRHDRSLLLHAGTTFAVRGATALGTLGLNFVLARTLGIEGVGLFMLGWSICTALLVISRFGLDSAILRHGAIALGERNPALYQGIRRQALAISLPVAGLLSLGLWAGKERLAAIFNNPALAATLIPLAILLPLMTQLTIQGTWMKVLKRPMLAPLFETGGLSLAVCLLAMAGWASGNTLGLTQAVWSLPLCAALMLPVGAWILRYRSGQLLSPPKGRSQRQYDPGLYRVLPDFLVLNITVFLAQWSTPLILGFFADNREIGLFSTAHRLATSVSFILLVFNSITSSRFAALFHQRNIGAMSQLAKNTTLYMTLMSLPPLLIMLVFSRPLLRLFGPEFVEAALLLQIMAVAQFINTATGSVSYLLSMTGHHREIRNIVIGTGLLSLTLNFSLSPQWGGMGAAIAFAIPLIAQNLLAAWKVRKLLGIQVIPGFR